MPLKDDEGNIVGLLGISFDITNRKQKEKQLEIEKRQTEIALENIIANMPEHVYWKDRNGVLLGCNDLQAKRLGLKSRKDVVGKTAYDMVIQDLPEEDKISQAEAINKTDFEIMETGIPKTVEEPFILPNADPIIFLSKKTPLRDKSGNVVGLLGISFDITERKKLEEKFAEAKVREAHFKAMSALGGMMAHELKTPLMSIALNARSIKNFFPILMKAYREYIKISGTQEIREGYLSALDKMADNTEQSAHYANNTIKTILEGFHYSASESVKVEEIDVNAVIQRALNDYPLSEEERALITFHPTRECKALGSSSIIIHVFHNLLKNALYVIQAANKGVITISVKKRKEGAVQIQFQDTAKGMSEKIREHIFEPFYTTKDTKTSIGLGLYFCKMALNKMDAHIICESKEGEYALFTIILKGLSSEKRKNIDYTE